MPTNDSPDESSEQRPVAPPPGRLDEPERWQPPGGPNLGTPRRTWVRGGSVLLALVAVGVLVVLLLPRGDADEPPASDPSSPDATAASEPPTRSTGPSAAAEQAAIEGAREAYRGFIATIDRLQIAGDAAERPREEIEAEINQYATGTAATNAVETIISDSTEGITQEGRIHILDMEIIDIRSNPQEGTPSSIVVDVCLDVSRVDRRRADGSSLIARESPERVASQPTLRYLNEGGFGGWRVETIAIEQGERC